MENNQQQQEFSKFLERYLREFLEVFVSIMIIKFAMEKTDFDLYVVIYESLIIGFLTTLLSQHSEDFTNNIKQGILFSVGSQMISRHM